MLPKPLSVRNGVPFYNTKTEADFNSDPYEDYARMVTRQLDLHFGHEHYHWTPINNWLLQNLKQDHSRLETIVEIGCGLGCQIAMIANKNPRTQAYGFDYSYQMLRQAKRYYLDELDLKWLSQRGFGERHLPARSALNNLHFGLAKADELPLPDNSVDLIFSCFLFDRLDNADKVLSEWHRILKTDGRMIIISPMNFQNAESWKKYHPKQKLIAWLQNMGWTLELHDNLKVQEPLDASGNYMVWSTVCLLCTNTKQRIAT